MLFVSVRTEFGCQQHTPKQRLKQLSDLFAHVEVWRWIDWDDATAKDTMGAQVLHVLFC